MLAGADPDDRKRHDAVAAEVDVELGRDAVGGDPPALRGAGPLDRSALVGNLTACSRCETPTLTRSPGVYESEGSISYSSRMSYLFT